MSGGELERPGEGIIVNKSENDRDCDRIWDGDVQRLIPAGGDGRIQRPRLVGRAPLWSHANRRAAERRMRPGRNPRGVKNLDMKHLETKSKSGPVAKILDQERRNALKKRAAAFLEVEK
jgi:hypothetical protein